MSICHFKSCQILQYLKMSPSQKIINTNPPHCGSNNDECAHLWNKFWPSHDSNGRVGVKYLSDALEVTSSLSCHILIKYPMPIGDQFKSQAVKRTFYHVTIPAYLAVNLMFLSPKKEHKFRETSSILVNPY